MTWYLSSFFDLPPFYYHFKLRIILLFLHNFHLPREFFNHHFSIVHQNVFIENQNQVRTTVLTYPTGSSTPEYFVRYVRRCRDRDGSGQYREAIDCTELRGLMVVAWPGQVAVDVADVHCCRGKPSVPGQGSTRAGGTAGKLISRKHRCARFGFSVGETANARFPRSCSLWFGLPGVEYGHQDKGHMSG